jgi:hypothetical protein
MRFLAIVLGFLPLFGLLPGVAMAQGALPPRMIKAIKADPEAYLQDVAALIASAGQGDAITADQLAVSIAVQRARARVDVLAPLLEADLNGDGAVAREELLGTASALKSEARAKLDRAFGAADGDGDGLVTGAELAAKGEDAALSVMGPARLAEVKVLMGFDADADGSVTLDEVRNGLQALVS